MTWVVSTIIALVILAILILIAVSDTFADYFGIIVLGGVAMAFFTLLIHLLLFG